MDVLIYVLLVLGGALVNFVWKPVSARLIPLASALIVAACLIAVSYWVYYFGHIKNTTVLRVLAYELHWVSLASDLVYGYLLGYVLFRPALSARLFNRVLWAASIGPGNAFILCTVGKALAMPDMLSFFHQSGYATWFLYFIMAAETAGGIGILTHFRLRMGIPAVIGLILIMLGAVETHWHNGDPFSDSYGAVSQLVGLSGLLAVLFRERVLGPSLAATTGVHASLMNPS